MTSLQDSTLFEARIIIVVLLDKHYIMSKSASKSKLGSAASRSNTSAKEKAAEVSRQYAGSGWLP